MELLPATGPLPNPSPALVGSTFVLRPFRAEDFDAARRCSQDPATARWVPPLPADSPDAVVALFRQYQRDGDLLHLVIADRTDDAYLGELMLAVDDHRTGEIGCALAPATRGGGLATEALRLFTTWCAATLDLGRLQVLVAQENEPALRLAERAGFEREGVLRSYWDLGGTRLDVVMHSLVPQDTA